MRKSLNLAGDGDEVGLILDLEEIFKIEFTDAELEACRTAGDLNGIIWRRLSERADAGNIRCMNAMAFYALRRALVSAGTGRKIKSSDRLDSFAITPRALSLALSKRTGLTIGFAWGKQGTAAGLAMLAGAVCLLLGINWHALLIVAGALFMAGKILFKLDNGSYKGCETVADAAAKISAANFGRLVERGARFKPKSVWQALCKALSWHGECPEDEIGPSTLLIHP